MRCGGELPDTTPCPESVASIATCYTARHETGAYLFTVMPKNWNGNLVVFAHGGPTYTPPTATSSQRYVDRAGGPVAVKRGFAWIASSYRREGYGVAMAAEDSDNARKFFIARLSQQTWCGPRSGPMIYFHCPDKDSSWDSCDIVPPSAAF